MLHAIHAVVAEMKCEIAKGQRYPILRAAVASMSEADWARVPEWITDVAKELKDNPNRKVRVRLAPKEEKNVVEPQRSTAVDVKPITMKLKTANGGTHGWHIRRRKVRKLVPQRTRRSLRLIRHSRGFTEHTAGRTMTQLRDCGTESVSMRTARALNQLKQSR